MNPRITTLFEKYARLRNITKTLWRRACAFDGINPASSFVCFSEHNPWTEKHGRAMALWMITARRIRENNHANI